MKENTTKRRIKKNKTRETNKEVAEKDAKTGGKWRYGRKGQYEAAPPHSPH